MTFLQIQRHSLCVILFLLAIVVILPLQARAETARQQIIDGYAKQATSSPEWKGAFSTERGREFFVSTHGTGKPDTPACTSCHGNSPQDMGQTRAGKPIEPMAISRTANRYTDIKKVEKWFLRNCNSVLGRECTPQEKGDFLTFMIGQ